MDKNEQEIPIEKIKKIELSGNVMVITLYNKTKQDGTKGITNKFKRCENKKGKSATKW